MTVAVKLLDSDKSGTFTSHNFGNVLAGTDTNPDKLIFVNSYGDATASGVEFGILAVAGNDGSTFAQFVSGSEFDASTSAITGGSIDTGGSISGSSTLFYKVTVEDPWGWESEPDSTYFSATLGAGDTWVVYPSWTAVSGASYYGLYLSTTTETGTYNKVTRTSAVSYTDTSGTATTGTAPTASSVAYRQENAWQTAALTLGDMASGTTYPMIVQEEVPSGTTSTGNTRQHYVYASYIA